jgi:hypothetical protein
MTDIPINFCQKEERFWIKDGDATLVFDNSLKARDAVWEIKLRRAAEEERAKIVAWLRDDEEPYPDAHDIASAIEAGEHLK